MTSLDRSFWTGPRALVADQTAILQIGALCLRDGQDGPEVMMVKSSRGRWIIPKGWPEDGQTDAETAKAVIDLAGEFEIEARIVGRCEASKENRLSLSGPEGEIKY